MNWSESTERTLDTATNIVYLFAFLLLFCLGGIIVIAETVAWFDDFISDDSYWWIAVAFLFLIAIAFARQALSYLFEHFVLIRRGELLNTIITPIRQVFSLLAALGLLKFIYLLWQSPVSVSGETWLQLAGEFISAL